jgi:crotonobetainyl-CoA:carnitine CoA-transferase CaiB-like acyl-CoA transferase
VTLLAHYRVLDLTDERGQLAGFLLAQLGADVTLAETGPPGPRGSADLVYNRGKRSVEVDTSTAEGIRSLRQLVVAADVVLTTGGPAELTAAGFAYEQLAAWSPNIVHVAISAFGQSGPKADYLATDIVALAAGGLLWLTGDEDRPPVRVSVPQAFANAACDAAGAALIALWERRRSGWGQSVDVSAQASLLQTTQCMILAEALGAPPAKRRAGGYYIPPLDMKMVWKCRDGEVTVTFMFGAAVGPFTARLMEWVRDEGYLSDELAATNWIRFSAQVVSGEETLQKFDRLKEALQTFLLTRTKEQLLEEALRRGLVIAPITTVADVAHLDQLRERGYWELVPGPGGGPPDTYCGAMAKFSRSPLPTLRAAPVQGADTAEVLREWTGPSRSSRDHPPTGETGARPLDNIKVLDLTWAMAGPGATRVLADHGATVVRIESSHHPEAGRHLQPFVNGVVDIEGSGVFLNMNTGKLGMAVDLNHPGARPVIHDLVRWADVVCETFRPGTMEHWGFGYEDLRRIKPDVIMFSSALMGQSGPLRHFAGYGNLSAALCGFYHVTGWPDRNPTGPYSAYTDYVAPRFSVAILMAALEHHRQTGEGQHIDFSHVEGALHLLAPAFLDYFRYGRVAGREGNLDCRFAPHGVYPTEGDDRWIALAVQHDDAWSSLCRLADFEPDLAALEEKDRLRLAEKLDARVAGWTATKDRDSLERLLQDNGIAAHAVHASADSLDDAQLACRRHFVKTDHQIHGEVTVEGSRWIYSRTPPPSYRAAPTLGQDTFEVLTRLLGYDEEKVANLYAEGVLD